MSIQTFDTKYGLVSLFKNDMYIIDSFIKGGYWDESTLLLLQKYINPDKNIIEIGAHVGTSTLVYASFLNANSKIYAFEPQRKLYELFITNIYQNSLEDKIVPYNCAVFCASGKARLCPYDIDGAGGVISKRYDVESNLPCNFGGVGLAEGGEECDTITIDSLDFKNVGFIHIDAQGAENWILTGAIETIRKHRPVILFEDNQTNARYLYNNVYQNFKDFQYEGTFNIVKFCKDTLGYSAVFPKFNGSIDTLLIP